MVALNEEQQNQNQDATSDEELIADLPVLTPTGQAEQTLGGSQPLDTSSGDQGSGFPSTDVQGREVPGFTSRIDLSIPANRAEQERAHNEWWNYGQEKWGGFWPYTRDDAVDERNRLRHEYYMKYYGVSHEEYMNKLYGAGNPENNALHQTTAPIENLAAISGGTALPDFTMDLVGMFPGLGPLDDWWDEKTRFKNDFHQGIREMLSVVIPAIYSGGRTQGFIQASPAIQNLPKLQKLMVRMGLFSAQEAAIIGISDEGEDHNMATMLAQVFPGWLGPEGWMPLPDSIKTLDTDSPAVRRWKNMLDTTAFSVFGTVVGAGLKAWKDLPPLDWFIPGDDLSKTYKANELLNTAPADVLVRMQEIETLLSGPPLSKANAIALEDELLTLRESLGGVQSVDDAIEQFDRVNAMEEATEIDTTNSLKQPGEIPDTAIGRNPAENPRQSVSPANVARNIADTTAIKTGTSKGDPAPLITESMRQKGLLVGNTSRDAVMGVAAETKDIGRFDAIVDGFRFSSKEMNAAAWDIYGTIIDPNVSVDQIRELFLENKDVKTLLSGNFKVEYINEEQARAAAFALRDLTDKFLGRDITMASARTMDTLGREAATIAESITKIGPTGQVADSAMDLIIDKMQFLMDEYGLNKYIAGWSLRNKNWFDQIPPNNIDEVIETLKSEFTEAANSIHARNLQFTEELIRLKKENPLAMRPLVDAYAHTNGDVDSLAKLHKWAAEQVTPTGLLRSPNPKEMNLFTRSTWAVIYNNVLSGVSAFRAGLGNTSQLMLKPITGVLGHGIWGAADGFEGLKRTIYYNGAVFETNRRALSDAWSMMVKANKDPEAFVKASRKDFIVKDDAKWEILNEMRSVWEQEGNIGRIMQFDLATNLRNLSKISWLRYGQTGMVFTDVFSQTHLAHYLARVRAYDDIFSEFGFADWKKIHLAEQKHYNKLFDKDGLPRDPVLKAVQGEVALNLDDGLSKWIDQGTTAYPAAKFLLMFPRTGVNDVRNALSWTPISAIPGINKYSKTIWARTDDEIAVALAEHGIPSNAPNAKVIFENLRAEYTGRIAFGALLTQTGWQYAMTGNIRGNGHYNASRRNKERTQFGYEPKTINIGGKWVSYKGIPGIDPILSILGDLAYYARDVDQTFAEDIQAKMSWTIAATFLNETPFASIEPLVAAVNGDLSGWNRLVSNIARSFIPQSGGLGLLSNAITSTQKDIDNSIISYVQNRIPIASSFLPEQIDVWTGEPINDIDNPFLRILNAASPIKISHTYRTEEQQKVMDWLREVVQWDGMSKLRKDSTGSYEYTAAEREIIFKYMGEEQLWKKLIPLMNSTKYNDQLGRLRAHRTTGQDLDNDRIQLEASLLPLYKEIDTIIRNAQRRAEFRLLQENPDIATTVKFQTLVDAAMKRGDVEEAHRLQAAELEQRKASELEQLLTMPK